MTRGGRCRLPRCGSTGARRSQGCSSSSPSRPWEVGSGWCRPPPTGSRLRPPISSRTASPFPGLPPGGRRPGDGEIPRRRRPEAATAASGRASPEMAQMMGRMARNVDPFLTHGLRQIGATCPTSPRCGAARPVSSWRWRGVAGAAGVRRQRHAGPAAGHDGRALPGRSWGLWHSSGGVRRDAPKGLPRRLSSVHSFPRRIFSQFSLDKFPTRLPEKRST
jgi:hypothetical protein